LSRERFEKQIIMNIPDNNSLNSVSQSKEALLNEEKGNLFEFLVAQILSRLNKIEAEFFLGLNSDLKKNMALYEESIRQFHPNLIPMLVNLANLTANTVDQYLKLNKIIVKNIFLIGKISANFEKDQWHEADLVLKTETDILIPVSLKLSKDHSYMNTKSAGAKSFIEKYFNEFSESKSFQQVLNKEIDQAFVQMAHRLYQMASLEFVGKFDQNWREKWSELPGELPADFREVIFINYARVAVLIHQQLVCLLKSSKEKFISSLAPLCGMGDRKIIQVSCYHQQHRLKSIEIKKFEDLFYSGLDIVIEPLKENMSSFDILIGKTTLQIRVKPMNKFTTASYKINCSIKLHKD
jgi:hypothetical protein